MTKKKFLRKFANWLEDCQSLQSKNSQKFTLNKQTSLFQTDCLEMRFSKYRQISGGRFLFGLREMQLSERILSTISLLKASVNIWDENISSGADDESIWSGFEHDLELLESDIDT